MSEHYVRRQHGTVVRVSTFSTRADAEDDARSWAEAGWTTEVAPVTTMTKHQILGWFLAAVAALTVVIVLIAVAVSSGTDNSNDRVDPCSAETMDAPYEYGTDYWNRDQSAERTMACFESLDR